MNRMVLMREDSTNMASSWSASLVVKRTRDGKLELVQEVANHEIAHQLTSSIPQLLKAPNGRRISSLNPPGQSESGSRVSMSKTC
jgi:hypothetical protein